MSVQLLDKTRKINKLLHNNNSSKVVFNDICDVLTEILKSNVLVISRKGKVLGTSEMKGMDEIDELIVDEVGGFIDPELNERLLGILSTKENVNLQTLGFSAEASGGYQAIITPINIAGERLGTLFIYKVDKPYEIDDIILSEYGTTVVGLEMLRSVNEESAEEAEGTAEEGTKTEYPLTITTYDYDGNEIETTYEKAPEKVLAVYQGSIETMLALGLEDRLVATAGLDNEVPDELKDAFSKTNYLDEFTPSLETVTMLEPDMILSWSSLFSDKNLGNVTDWIDKGCNTYYNTNTRPDGDRTLENEFTDILNLGKIFDVQDKAQAIVDDAKAVIDKTLTATADVEEKPSVMVLEPLGEDITNYGAKSLGGDMVTQLGATLANPDASTAGKEDIIAANPDVIFVVYMPYAGDDPETVKESQLAVIKDDEALQSLDAVKNGRVYPIMLSEMYASATRTQDGIETFAKGLYPDVNLD